MQEQPSAREKRRLKAEARDELMPRAMLKSDRIWGYADPATKLIGVDTAQEANAERFLRRLSAAIDGLSIQPLAFHEPVEQLLGENPVWRQSATVSRGAGVPHAGPQGPTRCRALDQLRPDGPRRYATTLQKACA